MFPFPFFFFSLSFFFSSQRILQSRIPTFLVFGSRHCSTFWAKCRNGFYWSLMSGAFSDTKVTMLSASAHHINRCLDSGAFHKRPRSRSILPRKCASISAGWWKGKVRMSFDLITVMTILTTHLETTYSPAALPFIQAIVFQLWGCILINSV